MVSFAHLLTAKQVKRKGTMLKATRVRGDAGTLNWSNMKDRLRRFPGKLRAPLSPASRPARCWKHAVWGFIAATCGLLALAGVTSLTGHGLIIGSFGASAVLLYGTPDSPLAQPRNVLGGHLLSALVGCAMVEFVGTGPMALAAAVGLAIVAMYVTHTMHPPGGATALIAVYDHAGWMFVLLPVTVGAAILVVIAVLANNVVNHRRYPLHWW